MIESDALRILLLWLTAAVFTLLALRSLVSPQAVAHELGYAITDRNGWSELYAIYVGLWLAHALLAGYAALHVDLAVLGDALAVLILGQPLGRLIAVPRSGWPGGPLLAFFVLEVVGGVLLLLVRPAT
ncbi:MAG: DUF4345 family protein [Xanthomonadales bacterium]|nr:hypothetical protein [Xanthomonadales bacterium]MCC6593408.1 DUF4345 family protein [Xanthomonadales bacterium]MCE7930582.1 DUF4345 domain-containing protein [Xanthomonadales bacterium PRO6]